MARDPSRALPEAEELKKTKRQEMAELMQKPDVRSFFKEGDAHPFAADSERARRNAQMEAKEREVAAREAELKAKEEALKAKEEELKNKPKGKSPGAPKKPEELKLIRRQINMNKGMIDAITEYGSRHNIYDFAEATRALITAGLRIEVN